MSFTKWKHAWPWGEGGYVGTTYDQAQERGKFLTTASKILMADASQILNLCQLRGNWPNAQGEIVPKDLDDASALHISDHVECLLFGFPGKWTE